MSNTKQALRIQGFAVTSSGLLALDSETRRHERCAVIKIDLERDSRAGRELIEPLITACDEPRCLTGRNKQGGAALLFRQEEDISSMKRAGERLVSETFKLASPDGSVRFSFTVSTTGDIDVDAYDWGKRGPTNTLRDALPVLDEPITRLVYKAAFANATWAQTVDRELATSARVAAFQAKIDSGEVKLESDEERTKSMWLKTLISRAGAPFIS